MPKKEKKPAKKAKTAPTLLKRVYPLNPPYAYATLEEGADGRLMYKVIEPALPPKEKEQLEKIKKFLIEELTVSLEELGSVEKAKEYLKDHVVDVIRSYKIKVPKETLNKILYNVYRDFIGYGKIDALMRDHLIEDISCDAEGIPIYIWHREYESLPTNVKFDSADELISFIVRLAYRAGKHISVAQPMLDASLPDGSRLQLTYGREVTRRGSTFTIRKFRADPLTIVDLIKFNTLDPETAAYLWFAIENRVSVLITGGVATGKTTLLNCLCAFVRPELKIVSVEDTPELNLPHENWISSVTRTSLTERARIDLFDLLKSAVRQRPDYIIVGEIRGEEAYVLFQALATGNLGMSTMHAETVDAALHRLTARPMSIPKGFLTTLDIVTVQQKVEIEKRSIRRSAIISEVVKPSQLVMMGLDHHAEEIVTNDVYKWMPASDTYSFTGRSYVLERIKEGRGVDDSVIREELDKRKMVLNWMVQKGLRNFREVGSVVRNFYANPERFLRKVRVRA